MVNTPNDGMVRASTLKIPDFIVPLDSFLDEMLLLWCSKDVFRDSYDAQGGEPLCSSHCLLKHVV